MGKPPFEASRQVSCSHTCATILYNVISGSVAVTIREWAASEQPRHEYANGTLICLFLDGYFLAAWLRKSDSLSYRHHFKFIPSML
jgi:hypothetical protein